MQRFLGIQAVFLFDDRWSPKKRSSLKLQGFFQPKSEIQTVFPAENRWSQKKRTLSQKCREFRCQSTKTTKIPVANTNLGLDLHSSSSEPVNFFGAQSSLGGAQSSFGGAQAVIWGGTAPSMPPVVPGLTSQTSNLNLAIKTRKQPKQSDNCRR